MKYSRWKLFIGHYKQLRKTGKEFGTCGWHGYNRWNCFWWALWNSKTHHINGDYLKPVGNFE